MVDIAFAYPWGAQQQTCCMLLHLSIDRTARWTDIISLQKPRYIYASTTQAVSITAMDLGQFGDGSFHTSKGTVTAVANNQNIHKRENTQ